VPATRVGCDTVRLGGGVGVEGLSQVEDLLGELRDILYLLALGRTNQEIGKQLFISVRTVPKT
jgi:DNA-binding NarL/FixJ family response regulator